MVLSDVYQVANYGATTAGNTLFPRLTISTLITLRLTFYFSAYFVLSVSPLQTIVRELASDATSVFRRSVESRIRYTFRPLLWFIRFRYLLDNGLDVHARTVSLAPLPDPS